MRQRTSRMRLLLLAPGHAMTLWRATGALNVADELWRRAWVHRSRLAREDLHVVHAPGLAAAHLTQAQMKRPGDPAKEVGPLKAMFRRLKPCLQATSVGRLEDRPQSWRRRPAAMRVASSSSVSATSTSSVPGSTRSSSSAPRCGSASSSRAAPRPSQSHSAAISLAVSSGRRLTLSTHRVGRRSAPKRVAGAT